MKPRVAIILPVYNSLPHLEPMLKCLEISTRVPYKLIIIESGSTDGTNEAVDDYAKDKKNVEVYHTKKNGLPAAINYGIKKAKDLDVYITQDDVIHFRLYGKDWLLDMINSSKEKGVGLITGLSGGGVSGEDYINGMRWAGTWNTYIPRKVINKVGFFDENMGPGDDIDYSYRVYAEKLGLCVCDFWVQHHRLTEHGDADSEEKQKRMAAYFKKKWGKK